MKARKTEESQQYAASPGSPNNALAVGGGRGSEEPPIKGPNKPGIRERGEQGQARKRRKEKEGQKRGS